MVRRTVLAIMFSLLFLTNAALAGDTVQWKISGKQLMKIAIVHKSDGHYLVTVFFKDRYTNKFLSMVHANIGKQLQIVFGDHELTSTQIDINTAIGDIVVGEWESKEQAMDLLEQIFLDVS